MPMVAWYVLSNESYMNRVIRDVFPTASTISPIIGTHSCGKHTALLSKKHQPKIGR